MKVISAETAAKQRVIIRVDWNVPINFAGEVQDDFKIKASLPTLNLVREVAQEVIVLTHLGNPVVRGGETVERTSEGNKPLRLVKVAERAAELLKSTMSAEREMAGATELPVYRIADNVILVENLRFHPGEIANDHSFAEELARLGDVVVNEAFPESHRLVASLVSLTRLLPAYAGLRLEQEVKHLNQLRDNPPESTVMILGGAKVEDKAPMIKNLMKTVDHFLFGGVMANTFLAAQQVDMRKSLVESDRLELAQYLLGRSPRKFILPVDFVWERERAADIGPQTIALFERHLQNAEFIFWNGPLGWTDSGRERFYQGSKAIAEILAASSATTVVAGGDTLNVLSRYHLLEKMTFCSTGGGATMAYLAGEELPGLEPLNIVSVEQK